MRTFVHCRPTHAPPIAFSADTAGAVVLAVRATFGGTLCHAHAQRGGDRITRHGACVTSREIAQRAQQRFAPRAVRGPRRPSGQGHGCGKSSRVAYAGSERAFPLRNGRGPSPPCRAELSAMCRQRRADSASACGLPTAAARARGARVLHGVHGLPSAHPGHHQLPAHGRLAGRVAAWLLVRPLRLPQVVVPPGTGGRAGGRAGAAVSVARSFCLARRMRCSRPRFTCTTATRLWKWCAAAAAAAAAVRPAVRADTRARTGARQLCHVGGGGPHRLRLPREPWLHGLPHQAAVMG
jgi:hypothetical protein